MTTAAVSELVVAVAGMGPMGRGIARVFDRAGARVVVSDLDLDLAEKGLAQIRAEADKDGEGCSVEAATLAQSLADADLFIEAIVENMAAKEQLLAQVRECGRPDLIVASNTSSLSISEMGRALGDAGRLLGLHFFNPPTKMRLVEVIVGASTRPEVVERALRIVEAVGKTPITCTDSPNFVVNRICRPLYYEAQLLNVEGVEPAVVDAGAREGLGHRMGPLELLDFTGLHTHLASSETALREFGDPRYRPIPKVRRLVRAGTTGRAAGRGFYDHAAEDPRAARGRVVRQPATATSSDVTVTVAGPDAASLSAHPAVAAVVAADNREDASVVVYSCLGAPTQRDVAAVEMLAQRPGAAVFVDSSDPGWAPALPHGVGWVRLHRWRDQLFAEVVEDDVAAIPAHPRTDRLLDALAARSIRVPALPGLVVDRLAHCLANEAYAVLEEGTASADDIDTALRLAMNHPSGPLEYAEAVGVEHVHHSLRSMLSAFGDPRYRPTQLMRRRVNGQQRVR